MFILYSALLTVGLLLTSPYWLVQMLRLGKYRAGLAERFGRVPKRIRTGNNSPSIWIHAVSVGEVLAVSGLVAALRESLPGYRVVVSTTTHTGQKLARERFGESNVFYFPLDLAFCIRPYIRALGPALIVLAETEFWPNFLRVTHAAGARIAVVNARISDRSFPGYRRWRKPLSRVLRFVDLFLAQSDEDATRLCEIGAQAERVHVSGNLKFDVKPPEEIEFARILRTRIGQLRISPVIVAGSTVKGEEQLVMEAFSAVLKEHPEAMLILAPRHKERFEEVTRSMDGMPLRLHLRSMLVEGKGDIEPKSVLLLDSLGELASVYAVADIAFVGGSLVPRGGHNILEPAYFGIATVVGPHTENFRDIIRIFRQSDAVQIAQPETFSKTLLHLLANGEERRALGRRARLVMEQQVGATSRTVKELRSLLEGGSR